MYQRQGKYALAETYAAQALAGRRHALGSEHPDTMASAADLALAYLSQGKFAESEPLAREALEFDRKKQPDDWQRFRAESLLGASLAGQKKYAEAEPLLLEGYQGMLARKERMEACRTGIIWTAPANGLSNSIRRGASRRKLPSGRRSEIERSSEPVLSPARARLPAFGGNHRGVHADGVEAAEEARVLDLHAAVHHYFQTRLRGRVRRLLRGSRRVASRSPWRRAAMASSTIAGTAAGSRKMSTTSTGAGHRAATDSTCGPALPFRAGSPGSHRSPRKSGKWRRNGSGRNGFDESPTMAMRR